ncbi:MAG: ATP-dependent Clp protease proteolytic subunit [Magnetococcales bacterium]|nr:ATP-dependent Clp protease proteolytic subunit [Magnetococcales bacterium]
MQSWYEFQNKGDRTVVNIHDSIGRYGITAKEFIGELSQSTGPVDLYINSPGGSVFEGLAISNAIERRRTVTVHVDGVAASIASVIAISGEKLVMPSNSFLMVHNPSGTVAGDAEKMRKMGQTLDKVRDTLANKYSWKTGISVEEIKEMMSAETWLTAAEAKEKGFCDEVTGPIEVTAHMDLTCFSCPPAQLVAQARSMSLRSSGSKPTTPPRPKTVQTKGAEARILELVNSGGMRMVDAVAKVSQEDPIGYRKAFGAKNTHIQPKKETPTMTNPINEYEQLFAQAQAEGKSKSEASRHIAHHYPEAHQDYIRAINEQPANSQKPADGAGKIMFNGLVDMAVEAGKSRSEAVREVVNNHPKVHEAYLTEANARP